MVLIVLQTYRQYTVYSQVSPRALLGGCARSANLPLDIDVTFAYRLNPKWAWWVYKNVGSEDVYKASLITQAARNASRDAVAQFTSDEATTTNREGLAAKMGELFKDRLVEDMTIQGLTEEEAQQVFTILPVQLRKALPPPKVLNAISEKEAAKQDLQRQKTLTSIAEEVANRRANEGLGVARLFGELPEGFTPAQISTVLGALANKTRADALLKAVETEQVKVIVVPDGNPVAVQAPTQ
jgi:regulator of protease activity HflC (stomatin/prohibitin superfamily)